MPHHKTILVVTEDIAYTGASPQTAYDALVAYTEKYAENRSEGEATEAAYAILNAKPVPVVPKVLAGFTGRMIRKGAEVIMIFHVGDKYYKATDTNCELMDAFMHTGDKQYLNQLEDEVEF